MLIIRKRDGRKQNFDRTKLYNSLENAAKQSKEDFTKEQLEELTKAVIQKLPEGNSEIEADYLYDRVVAVLTESKIYSLLRPFIDYRDERDDERQCNSKLMKTIAKIVKETTKENANIVNGPSAKMLQIGSESSKWYNLKQMPKHIAKAHIDGKIHIHDMDYYEKTLNCLQIPLEEVLTKGFHSGIGYIRPPKRIGSALALAAILLQASQNDCYGGQAYSHFDKDMAPFVPKEYEESIKKLENSNITDEEKKEALIKILAIKNEVYQAMEALIHNLNSMKSRAGNQVPFSSLNVGTDTSINGRLITEQLLRAHMAGLGHGETALFPNIIFRIKKGVNHKKGDPNYDLRKLAQECTAKRMNPTYSNMDMTINAKWNDDVSYMGCVDRDEVVVYRRGKNTYMESIKRLHERAVAEFGLKTQGETEYVDLEGYELYDVNRGFVPLHRTLVNPDRKDWSLVRLSNGRSIEVTSDHRWAIIEKGDVLTKNLVLGDRVQITWKSQKVKDSKRQSTSDDIGLKEKYLYGLLVTDGSWDEREVRCSLNIEDEKLNETYSAYMEEVFGAKVTPRILTDRRRGYVHQTMSCPAEGESRNLADHLTNLFGGRLKPERHIPSGALMWSKLDRLHFLAGMVDGDGYINTSKSGTSKVQFHIANKEVALQIVGLAQSLDFPAQYWKREDSYLVEFSANEELVELLHSWRKDKFETSANIITPAIVEIVEIIPLETDGTKLSYCVTTESSYMMCSFIHIGQCRSRVQANINGPSQADKRGNGGFVTMNIVAPAIEVLKEEDMALRKKKYYKKIDKLLDICEEQLLHRYRTLCELKGKDVPFVIGQNLYMDADKIGSDDSIEPALKHASWSIGFLGLAEAMYLLYGKHHGESDEVYKESYELIEYIANKVKEMETKHHLNFTTLASPAEGLSGRFIAIDRDKYGVIPWVTDKGFYTNSYHIPVDFSISIKDKLRLESPFHKLCDAGHISYVELKEAPWYNPDSIESIVNYAIEQDMGYMGINFPLDECPQCHKSALIPDDCECGCPSYMISRLRRVSGYLSDKTNFGDGKRSEEAQRIDHQ